MMIIPCDKLGLGHCLSEMPPQSIGRHMPGWILFAVLVYYIKNGKLSRYSRDFRRFMADNRIVEIGIAFVVGRAFNFLVKSFINDVLVGPVGLMIVGDRLVNRFVVLKPGKQGRDYPQQTESTLLYETLDQAQLDGAVTLNYGKFFQNAINFVFVGMSLFGLFQGNRRDKHYSLINARVISV